MNVQLLRRICAAVLFTSVFGVAAPAEARFGKRSKPAATTEAKDEGGPAKAPPKVVVRVPADDTVHPASPVVPDTDDGCCVYTPRPVYVTSYTAPAVWVRPRRYAHVTGSQVYAGPARDEGPSLRRFELMGSAQPMLNGLVLAGQLRVDGRRWGVDARYDHLSLLAEDGSLAIDTLHLVDGSVTFALVDTDVARIRAHLGLHGAVAPDVTFVGPGAGLSLSANLPGPFTLETGSTLVLLPYTKVDAHAALGLRLGIFEARGGLRLTFLDDQGRLDGESHQDLMVGPYLGMALVL